MVFIAAVALVLGVRFGVDAGYFLVVLVNYRLHIVHTTIADLDVVFVKKAVIFMMSWEMPWEVPPRKQVLLKEQLTVIFINRLSLTPHALK